MIGPWGTEWAGDLPQTEGRQVVSHLVSSREEFREGVDSSLDASTLRASEQSVRTMVISVWWRHINETQLVLISELIKTVGLNAAEMSHKR